MVWFRSDGLTGVFHSSLLGVYTMDDYNNGANITHNSRFVNNVPYTEDDLCKAFLSGVCTDRLTEIASFITGIGDQTLVFNHFHLSYAM